MTAVDESEQLADAIAATEQELAEAEQELADIWTWLVIDGD